MFFWNSLSQNAICAILVVISPCYMLQVKVNRTAVRFRLHGNVETFLKNTDNLFDAAAKTLIYIYSYFDHNPNTKRLEPLLEKSHFVNDQTKSLIEYFREKYEGNDFELFGARELIDKFMMNFGRTFEDKKSGQLYCHVLDI